MCHINVSRINLTLMRCNNYFTDMMHYICSESLLPDVVYSHNKDVGGMKEFKRIKTKTSLCYDI